MEQNRQTLNRPVEMFLSALAVERGLSVNTIAAYRRDLAGYVASLGEQDASPDAVDAFLAGLAAAGLSPRTIARKLAAVRGLHQFMVGEAMSAQDPTRYAETPRIPQSLPKALDVADAIRLVEAPSLDSSLGRRDRAMLEVMYATGARVTEIISLDVDDVDLDSQSALVTGKGSKQRLVPLGTAAVESVHRYLEDRVELRTTGIDPGALFLNARGGRLSRQGVYGIVAKHAQRVGIDPAKVSPHVLRHSAATHMVEGEQTFAPFRKFSVTLVSRQRRSTHECRFSISTKFLWRRILERWGERFGRSRWPTIRQRDRYSKTIETSWFASLVISVRPKTANYARISLLVRDLQMPRPLRPNEPKCSAWSIR